MINKNNSEVQVGPQKTDELHIQKRRVTFRSPSGNTFKCYMKIKSMCCSSWKEAIINFDSLYFIIVISKQEIRISCKELVCANNHYDGINDKLVITIHYRKISGSYISLEYLKLKSSRKIDYLGLLCRLRSILINQTNDSVSLESKHNFFPRLIKGYIFLSHIIKCHFAAIVFLQLSSKGESSANIKSLSQSGIQCEDVVLTTLPETQKDEASFDYSNKMSICDELDNCPSKITRTKISNNVFDRLTTFFSKLSC